MKVLNFFLLSLLPLLALSHHGDAGRFNDEITELHGTVVALQLINPHSVVLINVMAEDGSLQTWQVELEAPQRLARDFGWGRDTLLPTAPSRCSRRKRAPGKKKHAGCG